MYRAVRQLHHPRPHHQFPLLPVRPPVQSAAMPTKGLAATAADGTGRKGTAKERSGEDGEEEKMEEEEEEWRPILVDGQLKGGRNGMLEITLEGSGGAKLLVVRKGDDHFAMQPNCPNCQCPLVQGVLCKGHIRCGILGSAYNLRTGLLEDGVGLDSIWTFKVQMRGKSLFAAVSLDKLASIRAGPPPLARPLPSSAPPIVVVGAGIAAITCVETLRQLGHTGPIVLISREPQLPYDRKSLSKKLLASGDNRSLRSREFLEQHLGIALWLGHAVTAIHPEERRVMVEGERGAEEEAEEEEAPKPLEYSHLVLALGATNRRLQGVKEADHLEGVLYLHSLEDAGRLAHEVVGRNVAIIGSGFLGFEIASVVAPVARNVSIFGKASAPMTILGTEVGKQIRKFMQDHQGVSVRQDSILRSMAGFDRVQQLTFRDGLTTIADTVIVAIGIQPCTSILPGSGIRTNAEGYILVDERMQTSVPGVYACGDCVNFPLASDGEGQRRSASIPHWQIAQYQGRQSAHSILGISAAPTPFVPFLWIRLFDRLIAFSGDPTLEAEECVSRGSIAGNDFVVYLLRGDRVVGVASCASPTRNVAVQFIELFQQGKVVTKGEVVKNTADQWQHLLLDD